MKKRKKIPTMTETIQQKINEDDRTIYRIAKDAGTSTAVVSRFLKGERDIRLATADRIAKALGLTLVSIDELSNPDLPD